MRKPVIIILEVEMVCLGIYLSLTTKTERVTMEDIVEFVNTMFLEKTTTAFGWMPAYLEETFIHL